MTNETTPRAYTPAAFCDAFGIRSTTFYSEIAAGRLRAVKLGRKTLVPAEAADAWLAALPAKQAA